VKVPRLWRKKRGGKYYGACIATIAGADVNLGTSNAELARQRLVEALRGKRAWPSDAELAAQALEAEISPPAAAAAAPLPDPLAAAPAAAPVVPDAIEPPRALPPMPAASEADARAEAEATNAAAAETAGAGGADQAAADPLFTPDALEGMLATAAGALVEAQIQLQAWAIEKRTGKRPPALPEQLVGPLRDAAAQGWVAQFKRWFPDMADTPPWVIAVGAPLVLLPIQIAAAKPVEKEADPPPAQAAA